MSGDREEALVQAAHRVIEIDERERLGDETLTGFEWGEAVRALYDAAGEVIVGAEADE